jgi:formylglycine-generating enzyme required for sulfatase activity
MRYQAVRPAFPSRRKSNVGGESPLAISIVAVLVMGLALGCGLTSQIQPPAPAVTVDPTVLSLAQKGVANNDEWTPDIQDFDGVQMALVPAGCFMMGDETGNWNEKPAHEVCFEEPFWIDVTVVTNGQYGAAEERCTEFSSEDDQPRICVDWSDAVAHCKSRGARLPTEAEWEYAARGPDGLAYPWGNEFNSDYVAWDVSQTAVVGSKPDGASWVGALDMSGTVYEWVSDWYDGGYYAGSPRENPTGPERGEKRVLRGGAGLEDNSFYLRAAARSWLPPDDSGSFVGFRCALSY